MSSSNTHHGDLAGFVRERRRARGLNQRALAQLAGVGIRFVSELERGKKTVRLDHVNRVLAVFGKQLRVGELCREDHDS